MAIDDPDDLERVDREIRINERREEIRELAGGESVDWTSEECPPEVEEQFLDNVLAWEKAPDTSNFQQLTEAGVSLPSPDELDDQQLTVKLWEVIEQLAKRDCFLSNTDHLSDRQLYEHLWSETLHEVTKDLPPDSGWIQHLDILGGCSEEDIYLHFKYYADDESRQSWMEDWPDYEMPDHQDPPYHRDRSLPKTPQPKPPDWEPPDPESP